MLANPLTRYARWLHTGWPAGTVEKLPEINDDGTTRVPGVRIVGDLTGVPLLKLSADSGARAVQAIAREADFVKRKGAAGVVDVAIIGGGVSGIAAAMEAKTAGLGYLVFEAASEFSTVANFPKAKPIFTYPTAMTPAGQMKLSADVKEALFDELQAQRRAYGIECRRANVERIERRGGELVVHVAGGEPVRALRVIIAIGRSGNYRTLDVPGEKLDKVYHRLYDPKDYAGQRALVVGGGDSALETSVALAGAGASVTLAHRKQELARPKPENVDKLRALGDRVRVLGRLHGRRSARRRRRRQPRRQEGDAAQRRRLRHDRPRSAARLLPSLGNPHPRRVAREHLRQLRRLLRLLRLPLHVESGYARQSLLQRPQAIPIQYRTGWIGSIGQGIVRSAGVARVLLFVRLLRRHRPVRLQADPATEDALRHAADAGADGVPGHSALPASVSGSTVDGKRREYSIMGY